MPTAITSIDFLRAKGARRRLSMVTCYDYSFARLVAQSPIDGILVGDSVAMVVHGHPNTLAATVDMMALHTRAVSRGAPDKLIVADLPFLSYRKGIPAALDAAHALIAAGAHACKLEGVHGHEDVIERLAGSGVPVMGHIGMQPQSVQAYGGFRVQGRDEARAAAILRDAQQLEQLGAFAVVLECIPAPLAEKITDAIKIPTIGIGAGPHCDGQILVLQDLLGLNTDFQPRFARRFAQTSTCVASALAAYHDAVATAQFPAPEESFQ